MYWFVVVIVLILWTIWLIFKRRRLYELSALLPSPDCEIPILGVAHKYCGDMQVSVNPGDIEIILKNCLEKDDIHKFLRDITGNGGVFAPVSIWKKRRKALVPTFKPKNIEKFVEVFSEQSKKLVEQLNRCVNIGSFTVWPFISSFALDSVCETVMGVKIYTQCCGDNPFSTSLAYVLDVICQRVFHLWLRSDWIFKLSPQYHKYIKCRNIIHTFIEEVIKKKEMELRKEKQDQTETDKHYDLETNNMKSFLDLLMKFPDSEKKLTSLELREEMLTLALAGMDTSAVAICNTLKLFAKYPKVQERTYKEIIEVFGISDRAVEKEDLLRLKYLEMVLKESMRLFPPVPFIVRKVEAEIKLSSGYILPAGCGVIISIWGVHRDPKYWGPDAEHFDPERFQPERFKSIHPCSYLPFSNGPRKCLGYQYALMSIKTALTNILRAYKIVGEEESGPIPNIPCKLEIMMKAVDGYQIELEKRH